MPERFRNTDLSWPALARLIVSAGLAWAILSGALLVVFERIDGRVTDVCCSRRSLVVVAPPIGIAFSAIYVWAATLDRAGRIAVTVGFALADLLYFFVRWR